MVNVWKKLSETEKEMATLKTVNRKCKAHKKSVFSRVAKQIEFFKRFVSSVNQKMFVILWLMHISNAHLHIANILSIQFKLKQEETKASLSLWKPKSGPGTLKTLPDVREITGNPGDVIVAKSCHIPRWSSTISNIFAKSDPESQNMDPKFEFWSPGTPGVPGSSKKQKLIFFQYLQKLYSKTCHQTNKKLVCTT